MNYGLGEYDNLEVGAGQLFFSFGGYSWVRKSSLITFS